MPFTPATPTSREVLEEIACLWADSKLTKSEIAWRFGRSAGWLDGRLKEARVAGFAVAPRQPDAAASGRYGRNELNRVAELLRQGYRNLRIAEVLNKDPRWVSRAKYLCKARNIPISPASVNVAPARKQAPARKVVTFIRDGVPISLPYLRFLDPEARA